VSRWGQWRPFSTLLCLLSAAPLPAMDDHTSPWYHPPTFLYVNPHPPCPALGFWEWWHRHLTGFTTHLARRLKTAKRIDYLRVVHECCNPEVWYLADEFCASLEMRLSHLVVLLLDLEDLFTRLLIQPVDFILNFVYPFYRVLLIFVCQTYDSHSVSNVSIAHIIVLKKHGKTVNTPDKRWNMMWNLTISYKVWGRGWAQKRIKATANRGWVGEFSVKWQLQLIFAIFHEIHWEYNSLCNSALIASVSFNRLCIFRPKGTIQIHYYYYYYSLELTCRPTNTARSESSTKYVHVHVLKFHCHRTQ